MEYECLVRPLNEQIIVPSPSIRGRSRGRSRKVTYVPRCPAKKILGPSGKMKVTTTPIGIARPSDKSQLNPSGQVLEALSKGPENKVLPSWVDFIDQKVAEATVELANASPFLKDFYEKEFNCIVFGLSFFDQLYSSH